MRNRKLRKTYEEAGQPRPHLKLLPAPKPCAAPLEEILSEKQFGQYQRQIGIRDEIAAFHASDKRLVRPSAPYGATALTPPLK